MPELAQWSLQLLGRFAVCVVGTEPVQVRIHSKKGAALLAYLAVHPAHSASREQLAVLLWGDRYDRQARQNLRQCLRSLRADLAPCALDLLDFDGDQIGLRTKALSVDTIKLVELAKSDQPCDLERAAALYRGPLLADVDIDVETFGDWLRRERGRFESLAADIFGRLAKHLDAAGGGSEAVQAAERLIAIDTFREDWQRIALRLYARHRGRAAALAHAQAFSAQLKRELDVAPEPETAALIEEIRRGTITNRPEMPLPADEPRQQPIIVRYEKASLTVSPFAHTGTDGELAWISNGITEDVVAALAHNRSFFVIAPDCISRDASERTRTAGELRAGYLLVGTIRRLNKQVRLTVRLVDACAGIHIWAKGYTLEFNSGFADLDAVTSNIAASVEPHIYAAEQCRLRGKPLQALDPAGCVTRALAITKTRTREAYSVAEQLLKRAIELDPACPRAHSIAAWYAGVQVVYGWKPRENASLALDAAERAVLLDGHDPWAYFAMGWALTQNRSPEEAIAAYRTALEINPHFPQAYSCLGLALGYIGQTEKALAVLESGERLGGPEILVGLRNSARAGVYFCAGNHRDAIKAARRSVQEGRVIASLRQLIVNCALSREMDEARAAFKAFSRRVPDISLDSIANTLPNIRDNDLSRTLDAFRLMGLR